MGILESCRTLSRVATEISSSPSSLNKALITLQDEMQSLVTNVKPSDVWQARPKDPGLFAKPAPKMHISGETENWILDVTDMPPEKVIIGVDFGLTYTGT